MTNASELMDQRIKELGDWRGKTLGEVRRIIREADPDIVEEWKWVKPTNPGVPVWSHNGGICTGETYKNAVKLTFYKGASLEDPAGLFNSSLEGKVRRAIDIKEGEMINEKALKILVRERRGTQSGEVDDRLLCSYSASDMERIGARHIANAHARDLRLRRAPDPRVGSEGGVPWQGEGLNPRRVNDLRALIPKVRGPTRIARVVDPDWLTVCTRA